jgi:hypothetical protein
MLKYFSNGICGGEKRNLSLKKINQDICINLFVKTHKLMCNMNKNTYSAKYVNIYNEKTVNFYFKKNLKFFSTTNQQLSSQQHQENANEEKEDETPQLRQIQLNPRYEAAISFFVTGDYDRAIKSLMELKRNIMAENRQISEDYLFLLKKIISINKVNKDLNSNTEILFEVKEICLRLYKSDFNYLFENLEYIVINLTNYNPAKAIEFVNEILEGKFLPNFFEHIFKYYQGSAYILEGKSLNKAIEILDSIEKEIDDKYLRACVYNNKACAMWWMTMTTYVNQMKIQKGISLEIVENLATEMLSIIKFFKEALGHIEEISDFRFEEKYIFNNELPRNDHEQIRINFLKYFLSKNFDRSLKLDPNYLKSFGEYKQSLTSIKTSAIIFSNIGELYYNIRDYKKSLIALNAANLFFQNHSRSDPLLFKNLALVAMNNWKLTNQPEGPKSMFEKLLVQLKQFPTIYEKIFVFRIYGEMLLEQNNQSVLGNNLLDEANKMEQTLPLFESFKIYLTLPSEI